MPTVSGKHWQLFQAARWHLLAETSSASLDAQTWVYMYTSPHSCATHTHAAADACNIQAGCCWPVLLSSWLPASRQATLPHASTQLTPPLRPCGWQVRQRQMVTDSAGRACTTTLTGCCRSSVPRFRHPLATRRLLTTHTRTCAFLPAPPAAPPLQCHWTRPEAVPPRSRRPPRLSSPAGAGPPPCKWRGQQPVQFPRFVSMPASQAGEGGWTPCSCQR